MTWSCDFTLVMLWDTRMYTHGSNLLLPVGTTWVMPEYEDIDIVLVPSDCGDGEESSSRSKEDSDEHRIGCNGRG